MEGDLRQIGLSTDLIFLPNKVSPFICRNLDMFEVLRLLSEENTFIVQIWGIPGLGKSSLLKNVTVFLGERDIYKDGIVYIDFLHVMTFKEVLQIIAAYLKDVRGPEDYYDEDCEEEDEEIEEILKLKITNIGKKFLFSFDNIECLLEDNHSQFMRFICDIANSQSGVKILFTSSKFDAMI